MTPRRPPGFATVTPFLRVERPLLVVGFLGEALAAKVVRVTRGDDGTPALVQVRIDDCMLEIARAREDRPAVANVLHVYVDDVDATFDRAVAAGGTVLQPPTNLPWGERGAVVRGPGGNEWMLGTLFSPATYEAALSR